MNAEILKQQTFRNANLRRGKRLEYLTIGWNSIEAFVAIGSGAASGSASLVGFGVDSLIENFSAATLLWRLRDSAHGARREQIALKLVGISFLLLAVYIAFGAVKSLTLRESPAVSFAGIVIAALSLVVMPVLARAKRRVAQNLDSRAMRADSRQTDLCAYLSAILLAGLILNAAFGWWWADSIAALLMTPIIAKEGVQSLRGKSCGDCCRAE